VKPETHKEFVASYQSLLVANLIAGTGDPDGRNAQTDLADRIG
jgi:hypothetical protein